MSRDPLAELVAAARHMAGGPLPADVALRASHLVADTLAVMLAGGRRHEVLRLVEGDRLTGSWRRPAHENGPAARLLTAGHGLAAPDRAAYVNASAACALELDEGVRPTGHPASHVLPAALAAAEVLDRDWDGLLRAFVAGYEVAANLFASLRLRPPTHPHGHLGGIGAAVAVAMLQGDPPLPAARAAATVPLLTTWPPCLEGASARNTWTGHAAATGLLAQRLVHAGYRGSAAALEAAFDGLVAERVPGPPVAPGPRILSGYVKVYSACALTHAAIEAAARLSPVDGNAVAQVRVATTAGNLKVAALPRGNALSRRFSLPFAVAAALLHGDADPERFDEPDPDALALCAAVSVDEDPEATAAWPAYAPATVTVVFRDGSTASAHCADALGHPGNPAGPSVLREKFVSLSGLDPAVWDLLTEPGRAGSVASVLDTLTGG